MKQFPRLETQTMMGRLRRGIKNKAIQRIRSSKELFERSIYRLLRFDHFSDEARHGIFAIRDVKRSKRGVILKRYL